MYTLNNSFFWPDFSFMDFGKGEHWNAGRYPKGWRAYRNSRFDPRINRHTGQPHEHKREIARRQRQLAARAKED